MTSGRAAGPANPGIGELTGQGVNLALATWTFAINFWAWNLIGPLSPTYTKAMSLTSTQTALLVATPILVGSVGRIPVGALTDRYGGRTMFTIDLPGRPSCRCCWSPSPATIDSYALLLVFGFFLGIGGTTFAVGIPFVERLVREVPAWFRHRRVRRGHGRHRAVGVLHPAVRDLVRVHHRRTSSSPPRWR